MIHKGFDLGFEITWQEVVFQQDAVLQGLMPAFNLALGLGMIRYATRVLHTFVLQPLGQLPRDVACGRHKPDRNPMLLKPGPTYPSRLVLACWCSGPVAV